MARRLSTLAAGTKPSTELRRRESQVPHPEQECKELEAERAAIGQCADFSQKTRDNSLLEMELNDLNERLYVHEAALQRLVSRLIDAGALLPMEEQDSPACNPRGAMLLSRVSGYSDRVSDMTADLNTVLDALVL